MIAIRGNIRSMRSDNGTNFVGIENELKRAFQEMNHTKIKHFFFGEMEQIGWFRQETPQLQVIWVGYGSNKKN